MHIEWKSPNVEPYLSQTVVKWPGIRVHRAHVMPGRMLEHSNDCHEVNVAIAGTLTTTKYSATGRRVETISNGGNVCISPAGQSISAKWNKPLDNMMVIMEPSFVSGVAAENGFSPNVDFVEVYENQDPLIQGLGLSLIESSDENAPINRLYVDSLIQTLTLHLLSNYTTAGKMPVVANGGLSPYKLRRVIEFIDANLEEDLSLHEIAAEAELSPYHFSREFRKSTGKTPQQFVMSHRVERAKELLARPELPIVEVSLRTGFKNQSHFTTLFRKYTNHTPKLWRELKLA